MNKLEIINDILVSVDLLPVNSVDDDNEETIVISNLINQQTRLVLSRGYFFNSFTQTFKNTSDNNVFVTDDVLKIDSTLYALRGRKLWDLANNTDTISEPVTVDTVVALDIDEVPYECAFYIQSLARTQAQIKIMPDPNITAQYMLLERKAKRLFNEYLLESIPLNILDNKTDIWQR